MKWLLAAAAYGLWKGRFFAPAPLDASLANLASVGLLAPLMEETKYRAQGRSAFAFAADHVIADGYQGPKKTAVRFSDVLVGGAFYGMAYAAGGLPLAVAAHGLHNLGVIAGSNLKGK